MRATGLQPPTDRSAHVLQSMMPAKASATLAGFADWSAFRDPTTDQNYVGSCASNAVPYACAQTLAIKGQPLGYPPSVREPYASTLAMVRALEHPGLDARTLVARYGLLDTGSQLLDVVAAVERYGLPRMGPKVVVDYGEVNCDCGPANFDDEPTHDRVVEGRKRLIAGCYRITGTPARRLDTAAACLEAGIVLAVGGYIIKRQYQDWRLDMPPIGAQDLDDTDGGGHARRIDVYGWFDAWGNRATPHSAGAVRLWREVGSWGPWGDNGCCWVTDDLVAQQWEIIACDASLV